MLFARFGRSTILQSQLSVNFDFRLDGPGHAKECENLEIVTLLHVRLQVLLILFGRFGTGYTLMVKVGSNQSAALPMNPEAVGSEGEV